MDVNFHDSQAFFHQSYLQGEPFATDNKFFQSSLAPYTKIDYESDPKLVLVLVPSSPSSSLVILKTHSRPTNFEPVVP